jgi:hypothetical protein
MKSKIVISIALLVNLILGNIMIPLGRGRYETWSGKLLVHVFSSVIAAMLLLLLFRITFATTKKYKRIILPFIFSYLVPLLSVYTVLVIVGLKIDTFKSIIIGIPIALVSSFALWPLWLPLGIMNLGFVYWYSRLQSGGAG